MHRIVLISFLLFISACSQRLTEAPGVSYAKSVDQLGIFPVYPPREDIQVGDIFAVENSSLDQRFERKSVFVGTYGLKKEINAYLKSRYRFAQTTLEPKVPVTTASAVTSGINLQAKDALNNTLIGSSEDDYLPVAGFPEISIDTGISGGFGSVNPQQTLGTIFGGSAQKTIKMKLSFGAVTSYQVPIPIARRALNVWCAHPDAATIDYLNCHSSVMSRNVNAKYILDPSDPGYVQQSSVLMVSKVYLARQITYSYYDSALAGVAARVLSADKTLNANASALNALTKGDDATASTPTVTAKDVETALLLERLNELQSTLDTYVQNNNFAPTSGVSLSGYNQQTVKFTQIFPRPVVVGYEGVSLFFNSELTPE